MLVGRLAVVVIVHIMFQEKSVLKPNGGYNALHCLSPFSLLLILDHLCRPDPVHNVSG